MNRDVQWNIIYVSSIDEEKHPYACRCRIGFYVATATDNGQLFLRGDVLLCINDLVFTPRGPDISLRRYIIFYTGHTSGPDYKPAAMPHGI